MIKRPLTSPVRFIHPEDPALDSTLPIFADAFRRYLEGYDLALLEALVRPGDKPTIWTITGLSRAQMLHCQAITVDAHREDLIASFGLISVENLQDAEGRTLSLKHTDAGQGLFGPLGQQVSAESMQAIYDPAIVRQIAAVAWRRSRLCP